MDEQSISGRINSMIKCSMFLLLCLIAANSTFADGVGYINVDVSLDEQGQVVESQVIEDVDPATQATVLEWVENMQFEPPILDGQPMPSTNSVFVSYKLSETDQGVEFEITDAEIGPRAVKRVAPKYPRSPGRYPMKAAVTVEFDVLKDGGVDNAKIVKSTDRIFNRNAVRAILKWKYKPLTVAGEPVETRISQIITFELTTE